MYLKDWRLMLTLVSLGAMVDGQCVLPTDLRGIWVSSHKGPLNFTEEALIQYPVAVSASTTAITFTCLMVSGDKYLLQSSETFELFNIAFKAYLCLELHQVSPFKYWYHVANEIDGTTLDRLYVTVSTIQVDMTNGCNRVTPYETATFNTLIQAGAIGEGLVDATCPYDLLHTFSNGSLSSSDRTTSCTNVTLDVCHEKTRMIHTYDPSCTSDVKFAAQGIYICLHHSTDDTSGMTYLHVWNNDTTLADDINRINCYAYEFTDNKMVATLYPGSCDITQTSSSVPSEGLHADFNTITQSCQRTIIVEPEIVFYVAVILGSFIVLLLMVLAACVTYKTRCICIRKLYRKLCTKKGTGHSTTSLDSDDEKGFGSYFRSVRKSMAPGVFVARKPIKIGPIIEPYLEPPTKVKPLYDVEARPQSSRYLFTLRSLFQSQVSLRCND